MSAQTDTDQQAGNTPSRRTSAYRVVMTVGIVALAFAALWFVVNLLYALL